MYTPSVIQARNLSNLELFISFLCPVDSRQAEAELEEIEAVEREVEEELERERHIN